jgi:hypothetical protein
MLPSENVQIHSRTILAQLLAASDFPAGDNTVRFAFLQATLVGEEASKVLANLSWLCREAGDGAGGFEKCREDCAEEARGCCCGFLGGLGFLAARREREALECLFVHLVMVDEGGLGRLERRRHFSIFGWMCCSFGLVRFGDGLGIPREVGGVFYLEEGGHGRLVLCFDRFEV